MKTILFITLFLGFQLQLCFAQDLSKVTKADILKTVQHIQQLAHDQKNQLDKAAWDYQQQGAALQEAKVISEQKTKEAHENAKQRDVVIWAFALAFAGLTLRAFPLPGWYIVAEGALSLACGYAMGRFALAWIASIMP